MFFSELAVKGLSYPGTFILEIRLSILRTPIVPSAGLSHVHWRCPVQAKLAGGVERLPGCSSEFVHFLARVGNDRRSAPEVSPDPTSDSGQDVRNLRRMPCGSMILHFYIGLSIVEYSRKDREGLLIRERKVSHAMRCFVNYRSD
jgi:hypothetical protein